MNVEEAADVDERRAIKKRRSALPLPPHPGREAGDCVWEGGVPQSEGSDSEGRGETKELAEPRRSFKAGE